MNKKDTVILYVEDRIDTMEYWRDHIRKHWSEKSEGVRSLEKALELIQDENFDIDLAIHDRGILRHETDDVDDDDAGDALYYELIEAQIPVAVVSGSDLENVEPYRSMGPDLKFFSKPINEEIIEQIVDNFYKLTSENS